MDDIKPSSRRLRKKKVREEAADPSPPALSPNELDALKQICEEVAHEDISFESWQQSMDDLDLVVPIWVSKDFASSGGISLVQYSRTLRDVKGGQPRRERTSLNLTIPSGVKDGHRVTVPNCGDKAAERIGKLTVIINLKNL